MLRRQRSDGFTLIELLVSITVLGIIMLGLVAVIFTAMATDIRTKTQLDETRDQQFAAAFFGTDAQAATSISTTVAAAKCGTGTTAIEFTGRSFNPATLAPSTTVVSYVFRTATVDGKPAGQLTRQSCEVGGAPAYPLTAQTTTVVARNLVTTAPTSVCTPAPCGATSTSVTLSAARRSGEAPFILVGTRRTTP